MWGIALTAACRQRAGPVLTCRNVGMRVFREDEMLDWLGLHRIRMLHEVIGAYEEEIALEQARVASLRAKLRQAQFAQAEMEKQGRERQALAAGHVAHELQHRIESTEKQIQSMEQLLARFRGELATIHEK